MRLSRPRLPGRPGHLPDRDRGARRRRPAGRRRLGRSEGTVTNSERRVQRVRKALEPPGEARDDLWIIFELARRMGDDWGEADAEDVWNEVRAALAGACRHVATPARGARRAPVAVLRRATRASCSCTRGCGRTPCRATAAPFVPVDHDPPVDKLYHGLPDPADDRPPAGLVQHRRPDRRLHLAAAPWRVARHVARGRGRLGLAEGERVRVVSRRGQVEVPVRIDESLRPGPDVHDPPLPGRRRDEPADDRRRPTRSRARPSSRRPRSGSRSSRRRSPPAEPSLARRSGAQVTEPANSTGSAQLFSPPRRAPGDRSGDGSGDPGRPSFVRSGAPRPNAGSPRRRASGA